MCNSGSNRDLYLAIGELSRQYRSDSRQLEQYLLAILRLAQPLRNSDGISLSDFCSLLSDGFTAEPAIFDDSWRENYDVLDISAKGFAGWQATLVQQIVDLREMAESGLLGSEYRYFGLSSPRGSQWFNFDPSTYIECAMAGSLGGWEPGDGTGRQFVPGECATIDASGQIQLVGPEDIERPVFEMSLIQWDRFKDFLECGQMYE